MARIHIEKGEQKEWISSPGCRVKKQDFKGNGSAVFVHRGKNRRQRTAAEARSTKTGEIGLLKSKRAPFGMENTLVG